MCKLTHYRGGFSIGSSVFLPNPKPPSDGSPSSSYRSFPQPTGRRRPTPSPFASFLCLRRSKSSGPSGNPPSSGGSNRIVSDAATTSLLLRSLRSGGVRFSFKWGREKPASRGPPRGSDRRTLYKSPSPDTFSDHTTQRQQPPPSSRSLGSIPIRGQR